jgi:hypothetical protein
MCERTCVFSETHARILNTNATVVVLTRTRAGAGAERARTTRERIVVQALYPTARHARCVEASSVDSAGAIARRSLGEPCFVRAINAAARQRRAANANAW